MSTGRPAVIAHWDDDDWASPDRVSVQVDALTGGADGVVHGRNTAPKTVRGAHWSPRPGREAEDLLGEDMAFYRGLSLAAGDGAGHLPYA
jgi:hypothetical protein